MKTLPGKPSKLERKFKAIQIFYRFVRAIPFIPSAGRYNMTISHQEQFIWFRVAKAGTRTIFNHLKESNAQLDVEHANWLHYPVNLYGGYFKFAFVRNPWDRLVSCWRNKVVGYNFYKFSDSELEEMKKFENFVNYVSKLNINKCDRHLRAQSALIDLNRVDYVGRVETFDDDANYIFQQRLGLPEKEIVRKNVTSNKTDYRRYYNEPLAEKVAHIYQKDITIFGYRF